MDLWFLATGGPVDPNCKKSFQIAPYDNATEGTRLQYPRSAFSTFTLATLLSNCLYQQIPVMQAQKFVTPGERVSDNETHIAGPGVYVENGKLIASLVGTLSEDPPTPSAQLPTLKVTSSKHSEEAPPLPKAGAVVTVKITTVSPRAAYAEILAIDGRPLRELFKGTIRQQDVRQTEVDKVEIYNCFAPSDVVLAEVISLGDRHSYFLSTAKNELGVIYAKSRVGVAMVPVNWQEMQCPVSKIREFRKVAKQ